ncbi:hypothetical protein KDI_09780 [Dictyobacter arantiisoli]|uniref:Uncharacterized protein n=2 Tax=Dictyobacter arantiisoli TaxID=2014874 RepID=A0A5A5T918_9CHLR|nr:hypothetical protein KDI_09780 [Dictyobacter arantiisoli]
MQQVLRKQVLSGASKAIWPTDMRCCVHTNLAAQQRRLFIMKSCRWIATLGVWRLYSRQLFARYLSLQRIIQVSFALLIIGTAFVLATLYDGGIVLHHWLTILLLVILAALMAVIIRHLWSDSKREQVERQHILQPGPTSFAGIPVSHLGQVARSIYISQTATRAVSATQELEQSFVPQTQIPATFPFPETPMPVPATPLIRVLETIDLSSTNIKHFLDTKPHASLTISRDIVKRERRQNMIRPE